MDFNITKYKKLTNEVSESKVQLTGGKRPLCVLVSQRGGNA